MYLIKPIFSLISTPLVCLKTQVVSQGDKAELQQQHHLCLLIRERRMVRIFLGRPASTWHCPTSSISNIIVTLESPQQPANEDIELSAFLPLHGLFFSFTLIYSWSYQHWVLLQTCFIGHSVRHRGCMRSRILGFPVRLWKVFGVSMRKIRELLFPAWITARTQTRAF